MSEPHPVVAGIDGSPSSLVALDYAAALAARRKAPLHLVHGYQPPMYSYDIIGLALPLEPVEDHMREQVQGVLRDLVGRLRQEYPELIAVQAKQIDAGPATVLIEQSRTAQIVVVGAPGRQSIPSCPSRSARRTASIPTTPSCRCPATLG
jgi:nucleotide-binding universal stress UspA family protein